MPPKIWIRRCLCTRPGRWHSVWTCRCSRRAWRLWQVLAIVARRALLLIGSGTLVGLALALAAGRFLERILYGVRPTDPLTLGIVLLLMLAIAALACWIPARRAIRINPVTALRQE